MGITWTLSVNATYYQSMNFQMTTKILTFFKYCVCVSFRKQSVVFTFLLTTVYTGHLETGVVLWMLLFCSINYIHIWESPWRCLDTDNFTIVSPTELALIQGAANCVWDHYWKMSETISWLEGGILVIQRPLPLYYNMLASSKTDNSLIQASELLGHDCCT